jgi:hypothetical protein
VHTALCGVTSDVLIPQIIWLLKYRPVIDSYDHRLIEVHARETIETKADKAIAFVRMSGSSITYRNNFEQLER